MADVHQLTGHRPYYVSVTDETIAGALRGLADLIESADAYVLSITTEFITPDHPHFNDPGYYAVYAVLEAS